MRDKEFDEYLEGSSELSKRYRDAASLQPPTEVDNAILAEASRALKPKAQVISSPFASNWTVPLSLAAILVLCVGLVLFVTDESGLKPLDSGSDLSIKEPAAKEDATAGKKSLKRSKSSAVRRLYDKDVRTQSSQQAAPASKKLKAGSGDTERKRTPVPALKKAVEVEKADKTGKTSVGGADYGAGTQTKQERSAPATSNVTSDVAAPKPQQKLDKASAALLEQIRQLRKQAKHAEADRQLKVFRQRYPNYRLDESITGPVKK